MMGREDSNELGIVLAIGLVGTGENIQRQVVVVCLVVVDLRKNTSRV